MVSTTASASLLRNGHADGDEDPMRPSYKPLTSSERGEDTSNAPALLQAIFRVLESRGPKESMNMLRDIMESMKLVQAITGTGAAASFVHANAYSDTRGEAFGVLTALSTILALMALILTVIIYVSLGLLEHDDMKAVEGYLVRYWITISSVIISSVMSMVLLVAAVVLDAFCTYSKYSGIFLLSVASTGLIGTSIFMVNSGSYVINEGTGVPRREESDEDVSVSEGPNSSELAETSSLEEEEDSLKQTSAFGTLRCR